VRKGVPEEPKLVYTLVLGDTHENPSLVYYV
jgi:hypothetical protein